MPKPSNPGALEGEQLISLAEPFGGWVSPESSTTGAVHFVASVEGVEAATFAKQNTNQYAESQGMSLFTPEKFGHMAPGNGYSVTTDVGGYITDLPLNGAVESTNQLGIVVLKNGTLVSLDTGGDTTTGSTQPSSSTPTSSSNGDMILFRDYQASPVEWVVWSWGAGGPPQTSNDIAICHASNFGSKTDTFWSSTLSGPTLSHTAPHKLWRGPDGNIYFTDGPYVRQIVVGATAALTSASLGNVLQIGSGWIATGGCSFKNYSAIIGSDKFSNYSYGSVRVFLWDGTTTTTAGVTSTAPQYIYDIPDNFGNGIYFDGQTLFAFTSGRNNSSKIWELTGKGFVKVFETPFIPAGSTGSTNLLQGGIDNYQGGLLIATVKGDTFGHVVRYYAGGFHDEGYLCDGDTLTGNMANSVGMCRNLFNNTFFVGVKYGTSTYKIYYRNPNTWQTSTAALGGTIDLRSILYTAGILGRRQYPMGYKMTISRIKLFLSQWGTGASLYLSAFRGYDSFLPGNSVVANGGVDLLNILIDTNSAIANGFISGNNPGNYSTGYYHYCYPVGTDEIDLSTIGTIDVSSFYINIRWTHTSPSNIPAIIRRLEIHVAQSQ